MFTEQHYEFLAELIGISKDLDDFVANLVIRLKQDNPKFDTAKFISMILHIRGQ